MLADCTMNLTMNILIRCMIFVSDIQKLPIASHLKGMDSSFQFCCQGHTFVPTYRVQSRKSSCCLGNLESISGLGPSLEIPDI